MNIEQLIDERNKAEVKVAKINRVLDDKAALEQAIEDLKFLQHHAGEMIFTGNSGRIGERDVMLKKVKINTLAGCVAVPKLLIELAEKQLKLIHAKAEQLVT